jgi:uncharacterized protein with HEPN domain
MRENDLIRIRHMLDAARDAVSFHAGRSREDLLADRVLRLALVKCIEIIGEAASKVADETQAAHPEIPWGDIVGMRNRLIHVYFDVDLDRLCDTITVDLPPLISALEAIVSSQRGDSTS